MNCDVPIYDHSYSCWCSILNFWKRYHYVLFEFGWGVVIKPKPHRYLEHDLLYRYECEQTLQIPLLSFKYYLLIVDTKGISLSILRHTLIPVYWIIQSMYADTLVCTSGRPTAHGVPHDTRPTSSLSLTSGPPVWPKSNIKARAGNHFAHLLTRIAIACANIGWIRFSGTQNSFCRISRCA